MINAVKFESYVEDFAKSHRLFNNSSKYLLSVSGGLDSQALFFVLKSFKDFKFEVIHFNHGTRTQNILEEKLVKETCEEFGIVFHLVNLNLNISISNFENIARNLRKKHYQKFILAGYEIIQGHHLDDSFEWSLMQKFKQGNMTQSLGIPLTGNHYIRPFLCTSKKQILHYARIKNITWLDDSSNNNIKHERNFVRHKIISQIKTRYPQYLKHYVYQSNQLAHKLNCHHLDNIKKKNPLFQYKHFINGIVLHSQELEFYREEILSIIVSMSDSKRGKLNIVLDQIFRTLRNIKNDNRFKKFHGPYSFSGNVVAFVFNTHLYITKADYLTRFMDFDDVIVSEIKNKSQIPSGFVNQRNPSFFPNIFINYERKKSKNSSKLELPFYPKTIALLKKSDIHYSFLSINS